MEDLAQKYILQAEHNLHFLKELDLKFPNDFFDWKITVLFYTAIHLTKGFLIKKTNKEYYNHEELNKVIDHRRNNENSNSLVKKEYWVNYKNLYVGSQKTRYNGFITDANSLKEIQKKDYEEARISLKYIIGYGKKLQQWGKDDKTKSSLHQIQFDV